MRKGVNPEKNKQEFNEPKFHRIIIPIYIPNIDEEFYKESLEILNTCLQSLIASINLEKTAITIINNNSSPQIAYALKKYESHIDKIITFRENKGKVFAVINEARSAFEPFVTIADADVLFFQGWENEVWKVFHSFPRAGIVSPLPCPHNAFLYNVSVFFDQYPIGKMKYGKLTAEKDVELLKKGLNHTTILKRRNREYSWEEKQYYLDGESKAIVGAAHFVATYRTFLLRRTEEFPKIKFKKGYEENFLDNVADSEGYYRLSTSRTFAYHMGNKVDDYIRHFQPQTTVSEDLAGSINADPPKSTLIPYFLREKYFKALRKIKKL